MSITIRAARPADLDAVRACVTAAYMPYIARIGLRPAPLDDDYATLLQAGAVYVVPDEARVRAVLVTQALETALLIANVAVHPAYQGQGIGRALLAFAERLAIQRGLSSTTLYTNVLMTENIALYQRLGYVATARRSEHGFSRVFMCKPLRPDADSM